VRETAGQLIHVGRADFGLFQSGASELTRSLLPQTLAKRLERDPGVTDTASIFLRVGTVNGVDSFLLFGLVPDEFAARRLVLVSGRRPRGAEALAGDRSALARSRFLRVGRRRFPVVGVYHSGDRFEDRGAVLPLPVVQALAGRPGEVTTIGVKVRLGEAPKAVAHRLEQRFPGTAALLEPGQAVKVDTSSRLIMDAGWIFSVVALVVGGIGVANTMAMSVFERVREIGILRAVGWPTRRIAGLVLSEAAAIGVLALGAGLLLGWAGAEAFTARGGLDALVTPAYPASVFAWGLAFALGVAALGAAYPTWRAVRLTPIEALRHE
jgi:putative ABC transport system permease protein